MTRVAPVGIVAQDDLFPRIGPNGDGLVRCSVFGIAIRTVKVYRFSVIDATWAGWVSPDAHDVAWRQIVNVTGDVVPGLSL